MDSFFCVEKALGNIYMSTREFWQHFYNFNFITFPMRDPKEAMTGDRLVYDAEFNVMNQLERDIVRYYIYPTE